MLSRREWLALLLSGLAGTLAAARHGRAAEAPPQKIDRETAKYRDHPNDMQMCGMCKFYIPPGGKPGSGMMGGGHRGMMGGGHMGMMQPGTCELVQGSINPMGWCALYQPITAQGR